MKHNMNQADFAFLESVVGADRLFVGEAISEDYYSYG